MNVINFIQISDIFSDSKSLFAILNLKGWNGIAEFQNIVFVFVFLYWNAVSVF